MSKTKYMTMDQIASVLLWDGYKPTDKYQPNLIYDIDIFNTKDNNDLLTKLQKLNCKNPNVTKLVSQFELALSEKTPESKEFIKNFNLFINAIYSNCVDINKTWKTLVTKLKNTQLQYNAIKVFEALNYGTDDFEGTIVQELCVQNPHATANDILWYCVANYEPINSPIFQRGLKKFDEEFDEEAKKDKPNFTRILRGTWSVFQEHYIDGSYSDIDTDSPEYVELVSRYSDAAIDMRIRIAMLEKENKKLKAELRAKKTAGLKRGIANVASKATATKRNSKQR